ncbi:MAG: hypothetical protein CR982_01090 [Candidatus Cloacimonadota bacterium]|nr:MAG: hypothetical protein CR982_01090 [Candidatus Cloacimonadota bacterium]PIE78131.1 MAG: hypothetical protein CSA15_09410 [Candidatus Delongbacteria bacterium]
MINLIIDFKDCKLEDGYLTIDSIINNLFVNFSVKIVSPINSYHKKGILEKLKISPFFREDSLDTFTDINLKWNRVISKKVFKLSDLEIVEHTPKDYLKEYKYLRSIQSLFRDYSFGSYIKGLVSIIIPFHNRSEYTKVALESIVLETETPYEIILVNNGSTDDTDELMEKAKLWFEGAPYCINFELITNRNNLNFSKSNNLGSSFAKGEFLCFINNDTKVTDNWLNPLVESFKNRKVGASAPLLLYNDNTIQHCGTIFHPNRSPEHIYRGFSRFFPTANVETFDYQSLTAACLVVKHTIFDKINGFDENYINCFEDIDLSFKIRESGYLLHYNPRSYIYHFESKTPGRKKSESVSGKVLAKKWGNSIIPDADKHYKKGGFIYKDGAVDYSEISIISLINSFKKGSLNCREKEILNLFGSFLSEYIPFEEKNYHSLPDSEYKPLVSIIIPLFNNLNYTKNCINSILENTNYPNYEIVIIDNNSTDGTREYLNGLKNNLTNVKIILNSENRGFGIANNQGAKISEGKYLLCLNNDTMVTKGWLSELLKPVEESSEIVGGGSKLIYDDETIQHAGVVSTTDGALLPFHNFTNLGKRSPIVSYPKYYQTLTAATFLIERETFIELGGFNERYINCFEDMDLCYKISSLGKKLIYVPNSIVYHYESKSVGRKDNIGFSAKIMRDIWSDKIRGDYQKSYYLHGLTAKTDHSRKMIVVDMVDKKVEEIERDLYKAIESGEYYKSLEIINGLKKILGEFKDGSFGNLVQNIYSLSQKKV